MLPKLTIHNVPLDVNEDDWILANGDSERKAWKNYFKTPLLEKNDGISTPVQNGSTLEVIYIKKSSTHF